MDGKKGDKPRLNKVIARACLVIIWQVLVFFLTTIILLFVEELASVLLSYDSVKSNALIDPTGNSKAFLFVVAIPVTIASIINKPLVFWVVAFTSLTAMEIYIFSDHKFFSITYGCFGITTLREFLVLSASLLISFGISLRLLKPPGKHSIK